MRMLRTGIDMEFAVHLAAEGVLRKHAFNRVLDNRRGLAGQQRARGGAFLTTGITRIPEVFFLVSLTAGKPRLIGVDHDHVIAAIGMRRKGGLVLAAQHMGDPGTKASYDFTLCIDYIPLALYLFVLR